MIFLVLKYYIFYFVFRDIFTHVQHSTKSYLSVIVLSPQMTRV